MIPRLPGPPRDQPPPLVLVADEEPAVVEAIVEALQLHHYRVSVAEDGDEALRRAHGESPDLIIASVRLKSRGGLEICGTLRREVDWGDMPIVILSAASDAEARVEALAHGADDFLTKPFSPRELVARVQRLVSRARETNRYRTRNHELERDVARLEIESRRTRDEAERERSLRALSGGLLGSLLRTLDLAELDARLLRECCVQTGARSAALLSPGEHGAWAVTSVRGDLPERWAALTLDPRGACIEWLAALGRPALRSELERLSELEREVGDLTAHGVAMLAAVPASCGPGAVVVCEERADGAPFGPAERERFGELCAAAGPARAIARRFRAQQDRALELLSAPAAGDARRREAAHESRERLLSLAARLGMAPADRARLARVLELGPWAWSEAGREALAELAGDGLSCELAQLRELVLSARQCAIGEPGAFEDTLPMLAATGLRYQALRLTGRSAFESWRTTATWLGAHAHPCLRGEFPEATTAPDSAGAAGNGSATTSSSPRASAR
jgi:DNA-binding response OmpR family regulator